MQVKAEIKDTRQRTSITETDRHDSGNKRAGHTNRHGDQSDRCFDSIEIHPHDFGARLSTFIRRTCQRMHDAESLPAPFSVHRPSRPAQHE